MQFHAATPPGEWPVLCYSALSSIIYYAIPCSHPSRGMACAVLFRSVLYYMLYFSERHFLPGCSENRFDLHGVGNRFGIVLHAPVGKRAPGQMGQVAFLHANVTQALRQAHATDQGVDGLDGFFNGGLRVASSRSNTHCFGGWGEL